MSAGIRSRANFKTRGFVCFSFVLFCLSAHVALAFKPGYWTDIQGIKGLHPKSTKDMKMLENTLSAADLEIRCTDVPSGFTTNPNSTWAGLGAGLAGALLVPFPGNPVYGGL